eukprot:761910-Hanusia_phi.AAC.1
MACLSVVLPVFNAQPWLPLAVRDVMRQRLGEDRSLQLLCIDDASSDGSLEFLLELARLLGDRATVEACEWEEEGGAVEEAKRKAACSESQEELSPPKRIRLGTNGDRESTNPALVNMPLRAAEGEDHPSFLPHEEPEELKDLRLRPVTAEEVAAVCLKEHSLKVLTWKDGVNRGQGAAMTVAL